MNIIAESPLKFCIRKILRKLLTTFFGTILDSLVPAAKEAVTIRLEHKPGEKLFFDFADGIDIIDRRTGEVTTTQLFSAVLPFSSLIASEFVLNQKQGTLITAIESAIHEIGGVTPYVVVDNLKSAVRKSHIYDPDVNQTFVEFAYHCGTRTSNEGWRNIPFPNSV